MQKFYEDNKKTIWIVAGVAAAAGVAAVIYSVIKKKEDKKPAVTVAEVAKTTTTGELTRLERSNIIAGITVEYEGDHLTVKTITHITEAVVRLAIPEFTRITKEDREARRASKDNLQRYIELWDEYTQKLEEVIERSQKQVLRDLNITESVFENSNSHHVAANNQELFMLHATLPQKLKASLKPSKQLSLEEFKLIIKDQVNATNDEAANLNEISSKTRHPEEAAPIINNRVNDALYVKYLVEEEDILAAFQAYANDPEVQALFLQLQQATMRLLPMPEGLF
jgi:hypothetical protein